MRNDESISRTLETIAILDGEFQDPDGHIWVRLTQTRVQVEGDQIISTPEEEKIGEEKAVYGCMICDMPLNEGYGRPCNR